VYLARSFAASFDTLGARSAKISWSLRIRAGRRRTLRFPSEQLLQATEKSLRVGLFDSLWRALVSHIDEEEAKLSSGGRLDHEGPVVAVPKTYPTILLHFSQVTR